METDFTGLFIEGPKQRLYCPVKGRAAVLKQTNKKYTSDNF